MDGSNIVLYWVIIMAIFSFIIMIYAIRREKKIYKYGIEVEAVVTNVVRWKTYEKTAKCRIEYTTSVEYVGDDNQKHEALLNCRAHFSKGTKLKVKYLPGKYNYVVLIV